MKFRIDLIGLLTFFIAITIFIGCAKKNDTFAQEESQWLSYDGQNETVKKIIEDLKSSGRSVAVQSTCSTCMPDWDQSVIAGAIGDTVLHMLVPVFNAEKICSGYIKISLEKNLHTTSLVVYDFENDYVNNKDLSEKALVGMDFTAFYKKGIKILPAFSPDEAKKIFDLNRLEISKNNQGANAQSNLRVATECVTTVTLYYTIDARCVGTQTGQFQDAFMTMLNFQLASLTGGNYFAILNSSGLEIKCSPEVAPQLAPVILSTFTTVASQFGDCNISLVYFNISTQCPDNGYGDQTACVNDFMSNPYQLSNNATTVFEPLSEVSSAIDAITKSKNPKWVCLKGLTWALWSQELGTVKLMDVATNKWQWETLTHDKITFNGQSYGGTVTPSNAIGTPSFTAGTQNVLYAGMKLEFDVTYAPICDCPGVNLVLPPYTIPYISNALWDAIPRN